MKKFMYLALAALPVLAVTACSDDDDTPDVDISVNYENGVQVEDTVYAVMGDTLKITGIEVKAKRPGKKATGGIVTYNLNGVTYFVSAVAPYPCYIPTSDFVAGRYVLGMLMPIFEVDCTPATAYMEMPLKFVENADQIPSTSTPGTNGRVTLHPDVHEN